MSVTDFLSLPNRSFKNQSAYTPFILSRRKPLTSYKNTFPIHPSPFSPNYRERDTHFIKQIAPSEELNDKINSALESGAATADTATLKSIGSSALFQNQFTATTSGNNKRSSTGGSSGVGGKKKRSTNNQPSKRGGTTQSRKRGQSSLLDD